MFINSSVWIVLSSETSQEVPILPMDAQQRLYIRLRWAISVAFVRPACYACRVLDHDPNVEHKSYRSLS